MKQIPLTQGQFALVDDEDFEELSRFKWHATWDPNAATFYACRKSSALEGPRRRVAMHRVIMGAAADQMVDHRNHNGLDNRRENLRVCSQAQNARNSRKRRGAASKFKGVMRANSMRSPWTAMAGARYLGVFATERAAAAAYNEAARELFGEFALLNDLDSCQ